MKALIWGLCMFANGIFTTLLEMNGLSMGALPRVFTLGLAIWLAKTLCEKWDDRNDGKIAPEELE